MSETANDVTAADTFDAVQTALTQYWAGLSALTLHGAALTPAHLRMGVGENPASGFWVSLTDEGADWMSEAVNLVQDSQAAWFRLAMQSWLSLFSPARSLADMSLFDSAGATLGQWWDIGALDTWPNALSFLNEGDGKPAPTTAPKASRQPEPVAKAAAKPAPAADTAKPEPAPAKPAAAKTPEPAAATPAPAPTPVEPDPTPVGAGEEPPLLTAPDGEPDDLTRIKGIGPKLKDVLHNIGVFHFRQIAEWTPANADWVNLHLKFRGRIERENWIEQAKALQDG
ncbi:MAG: hypothetical protein ACFB2Z_05095 [Maricaulaceae bacterium]